MYRFSIGFWPREELSDCYKRQKCETICRSIKCKANKYNRVINPLGRYKLFNTIVIFKELF